MPMNKAIRLFASKERDKIQIDIINDAFHVSKGDSSSEKSLADRTFSPFMSFSCVRRMCCFRNSALIYLSALLVAR